MYRVRVDDSFAAAHYLTKYHGKCERLHGHNYRVRVHAEGRDLDEGGMLLDFGVLKKALKEVLDTLDHSLLNENPAYDQAEPSAELIARHIFEKLKEKLPGSPLCMVEVFETDRNLAMYLPDR
ncbi:MAG: 6-carboxytetrahydropterin synthase QueD [Spirochaetales bacterium]|nr:6-carboxytetrahydropterin synthase QueD [Spirochaetales bacterium]